MINKITDDEVFEATNTFYKDALFKDSEDRMREVLENFASRHNLQPIEIKLNGDSLSFDVLREANKTRLPKFKNAKGELAHKMPDGSDWVLSQWSNAVLGELGEAANIIKKLERGDFELEDIRENLAKEFADVIIYMDLLAYQIRVDLGQVVVDKFNEVSDRIGVDVKITSASNEKKNFTIPYSRELSELVKNVDKTKKDNFAIPYLTEKNILDIDKIELANQLIKTAKELLGKNE